MDTVVDVVPAGEATMALKVAPTAPIDLLGRQEIVDRIMRILEVISEKKSSCAFALNGAWGTGKTFVLNMLMNQLWEYHSDKYIVFHYNCWQYDYYEEPLIAIVAAMLDSVDEENHLLPANLRDKAKAGMELAKPVLKKIATNFVKNKIGVDVTSVVSSVKDYQEALDAVEQKGTESHSFDEFYSFKKAIGRARDEIRELTKNRTLVVVVDELDRCLPSYAIKVLERLHHLFSGLENTVVILAVDKNQLDQTIAQIFGNSTNVTRYLRKFVNFEVTLPLGQMVHGFFDKYWDYFSLFDNLHNDFTFPLTNFVWSLLSGIDMRTQERIIDRIKTAHLMLIPSEVRDHSFMCCELLWIVLNERFNSNRNFPFFYKEIGDEEGPSGFKLNIPMSKIDTLNRPLIDLVNEFWSFEYTVLSERYINNRKVSFVTGKGKTQLLILYYLYHLRNTDLETEWIFDQNVFKNIPIQGNLNELKRIYELLEVIT